MLRDMRRLHPRGAANRGICVDIEGAMLGPDCVLVGRTRHGFRALERGQASTLQKCVLHTAPDDDWLFRQCERISDALNKGEVALAQIYGLHIPVANLDDRTLRRLALTNVRKAGFNPDEPRIPKGEPHGGEWTTGDAGESETDTSEGTSHGGSDGGDQGDGGDAGAGEDGSGQGGRVAPVPVAQAPATASPNEPTMQPQMLGTGNVAADVATASLLDSSPHGS